MDPSSSAAALARPFWQRLANWLALATFIACAALLVWVGWYVRRRILAQSLDRQEVNLSDYLLGLATALFVPFLWMFFAGVLKILAGRPRGRWVALGWGLLTLGSAGPLVWHYRQLAEPAEPTHALRLVDVALGFTATVIVASLLPRPFRSGLGVGLTLCFALLSGLGGFLAAIRERLSVPLALLGFRLSDAEEIFTCSLEYALISGIVLGLLVGLGAWGGWITVRTDEEP